jgi:hypothetical protein
MVDTARTPDALANLHHAHHRKPAQRLANDRTADPELQRELALRQQPVAVADRSFEQLLAQEAEYFGEAAPLARRFRSGDAGDGPR